MHLRGDDVVSRGGEQLLGQGQHRFIVVPAGRLEPQIVSAVQAHHRSRRRMTLPTRLRHPAHGDRHGVHGCTPRSVPREPSMSPTPDTFGAAGGARDGRIDHRQFRERPRGLSRRGRRRRGRSSASAALPAVRWSPGSSSAARSASACSTARRSATRRPRRVPQSCGVTRRHAEHLLREGCAAWAVSVSRSGRAGRAGRRDGGAGGRGGHRARTVPRRGPDAGAR